MHRLRNHPYLDAVVAAGILLVVGALVVRARSSVSPAGTDTPLATWAGGGGIAARGVTRSLTAAPVTERRGTLSGTRAVSYGPVPLNAGNGARAIVPINEEQTDISLDALFAQLSKPASRGSAAARDDGASSAYAFIPGGLIATTTPGKARTPDQDALYGYGNEVGDAIQSFERDNPNQPAVLKNFMESRTDSDAIAAMKKLGAALAALGATLKHMDEYTVPPAAGAAHAALAKSYADIGAKLSAIPDAQGDEALLKAIDTYDTAAEAFAKKYVALVRIFQSYGVVFSPGDGGSVFTFSNASL